MTLEIKRNHDDLWPLEERRGCTPCPSGLPPPSKMPSTTLNTSGQQLSKSGPGSPWGSQGTSEAEKLNATFIKAHYPYQLVIDLSLLFLSEFMADISKCLAPFLTLWMLTNTTDINIYALDSSYLGPQGVLRPKVWNLQLGGFNQGWMQSTLPEVTHSNERSLNHTCQQLSTRKSWIALRVMLDL